ncbi:MAG: hypothetical protein P4L41_05690, partial [Flavipsychrobacter sp.]|nr:hypothetical protein [Flavipsychrobacter sp.]
YSKLNLAGSVATTDISPTGATSGQVLGYNGTSVAWTTPSSGSSLSAGTTAGQVYLTGAAGVAPTTPVTVSGDATLASTGALTLGTSGVAAGSYGIPGSPAPLFTVDGKGRITSAQNTTLNLTSAQFANQGTATTVLHGNAAGVPSFGQIANSDVSNTAAIAYSKLNLAGNVTNSDISTTASIAYSKLNLASSVSTTDLNTTAAPTSGQVLEYNGTSLAWTTPSSGGSGLSAGTTAGQVYLTGAAGVAPTTPVTVSGDATLASTGALTLGTSGVAAGSYGIPGSPAPLFTVDGKGRVTSAQNTTLNLTSAQFANQGTTTTVLHGNAAGVPSFGQITNSDVSNTAAIAYSKLNLAGSVATTDISTTGATSGQVLGYNGTNVVWTTPSSGGGGLSAGTAAGQIYLTGTAGAAPTTPVTVSGDITISSTGVTSYNNVVPTNKGGAGAVNGLLSANGAGTVSAASTTGSGSVVLAASPTLVTPSLGTPSTLVGTNISGTAANLTAGNVTTNANMTGDITSVGNATSYNNVVPATKGGTAQSTYAKGDILYASATNTVSKLSVGTNGQVLTVAAGVPSWAAASGGGSTAYLITTCAANLSIGTGNVFVNPYGNAGSSAQFGLTSFTPVALTIDSIAARYIEADGSTTRSVTVTLQKVALSGVTSSTPTFTDVVSSNTVTSAGNGYYNLGTFGQGSTLNAGDAYVWKVTGGVAANVTRVFITMRAH